MKTQIKQFDLYGKRNHKYDFLLNNNIKSINWNNLNPTEPNYFFTNKNFDEIKDYEKGFKVDELFLKSNAGLVTARDKFTIFETRNELIKVVREFISLDPEIARNLFGLGNDSRDWNIKDAQKDINTEGFQESQITRINYRTFDFKYIYYTKKSKGYLSYPRYDMLKHLLFNNVSLVLERLCDNNNIFITKHIIDGHVTGARSYAFPLYLYPDQGEQGEIIEQERTPNLNPEIVKEISKILNLTFTNEKEETDGTFAPIDILDYIYALLHSPAYREKYKEFLKIDFPRVPYPKAETFWSLVKIGGQIRQLHLLESPDLDTYITKYPKQGNNIVEKPIYKDGNVYINDEQYFEGVPEVAWNFFIGGYQPAQKWLKDRKGRELDFNDIIHYQKMIKSLFETARLMKEIDIIGVE